MSAEDSEQLILQTIMNLEYLSSDAEAIADCFKVAIDLNDGMIDGPVVFNEHTPVLAISFETIILIMKSVFSWTGFQARDQRQLLKKGQCRSTSFRAFDLEKICSTKLLRFQIFTSGH